MTTTAMNLFYKTSQGPNDGLRDWYYYFKGMSGDHFVVHELNHMDMYQRVTKRQRIMAVGEFMVELKYPQKAKDSLQKEIDDATLTYARPF